MVFQIRTVVNGKCLLGKQLLPATQKAELVGKCRIAAELLAEELLLDSADCELKVLREHCEILGVKNVLVGVQVGASCATIFLSWLPSLSISLSARSGGRPPR